MSRNPAINRLKLKSALLKSGYVILVCAAMLAMLEFTARRLGLGNPIIYYNSVWGGLRPLPNQQVTRLKGSSVTIDANGFRSLGPDSENAFRVLYLGDSVTWGGSSLDDSELFSEIAADVLRREGVEVYAMNAGVNGTSLMNQAEVFEQWQDSVDAVVWLFPWNDVHRAYATAGFLWPPTKRPSFALVEAVDHIIRTRWLSAFRQNAPTKGAEYMLPETPAGYRQLFDSLLQERSQKNIQALRTTVESAIRNGIPLIVGITPRREDSQLLPSPAQAVLTMSMLENLDVSLMDVNAALLTDDDLDEVFIDQVHFTVMGHALIGEALGTQLLGVYRDAAVDGLSAQQPRPAK